MDHKKHFRTDYSKNAVVEKLGLRKPKPIVIDGQPAVVAECGTILTREELLEICYVPTPDEIVRKRDAFKRIVLEQLANDSRSAPERVNAVRAWVAANPD